jgi:hypothetical protein
MRPGRARRGDKDEGERERRGNLSSKAAQGNILLKKTDVACEKYENYCTVRTMKRIKSRKKMATMTTKRSQKRKRR